MTLENDGAILDIEPQDHAPHPSPPIFAPFLTLGLGRFEFNFFSVLEVAELIRMFLIFFYCAGLERSSRFPVKPEMFFWSWSQLSLLRIRRRAMREVAEARKDCERLEQRTE